MNYICTHYYNHSMKTLDSKRLWRDLQVHIELGELVVNAGEGEREGLVLVTYSKTYQYEHNKVHWSPLVQHCRGIIFDTTDDYKVVALPMSKFFNYGEGEIHYPLPGVKINAVYEKADGSLGICFFWRGKWHLTTRGSLNSDIGVVGQQIFDHTIGSTDPERLDTDTTYLFEIIDPVCRIVVRYDESKLILIGSRSNLTGIVRLGASAISWWPHQLHNFALNTEKELTDYLSSTRGTDMEGFVVHYEDGSMFKFKSEDYMRLHRIISMFTFKRVLDVVKEGIEKDMRMAMPEEFLSDFDAYVDTINTYIDNVADEVVKAFNSAPKTTRKEFALYVLNYYKGTDVQRYVFKLMDHGEIVTPESLAEMKKNILMGLNPSMFKEEPVEE